MRTNFVTETVEEKIPVWLYGQTGVVRETLMAILKAADFIVVEPGAEQPFAIIVLSDAVVPQGGELPQDVPVYQVKFGGLGQAAIPGAVELTYEQVFAAVSRPVSLLDELTRRLVFDANVEARGGECAPLLLEDACEHIVQSVLSGRRQGGAFSGEKKISYTEFLSKLRAKLKLPRGKRVKQVRVPLLVHTTVPSRDLETLITQVGAYYAELQEVSPSAGMGQTRARSKPNPLKRRMGSLMLAASLVAGVSLAAGYVWYQLAARELASQVRVLAYEPQAPQFSEASRRAVWQLNLLGGVKDLLTSWAHQGKASDLRLSLPLLGAILDGAGDMGEAKAKLILVFRAFTNQDKGDALGFLREADSKLDSAYKNFSLVQARFVQQEVTLPQVLGGRGVQEQLTAVLPELRKQILSLRSMAAAATIMLDGKRSYALLLLDDTKLRGSGGTVVSVAVVTVDSGKLLTQQVYPASVVNQMLTGLVQAPEEVRAYLRQSAWSLPDATWDLPFSKAAERLSWFLGKELERPIDGVVTLPAASLPRLLAATGPIGLGGGEEVASESFASRREEAIALLPKNPDTLEAWYNKVFSALIERMLKADDQVLSKVLGALEKQLDGSEAMVNVSNQEAQRLFAALSWEGGVSLPACPSAFVAAVCRVSGLTEVENSLGGNHVNAFLKRTHVHAAKIGEDVILNNRVLTLTNTGSLLAWPYGSYQGLVKFMVPEDAQIQSLSLNDQVLTPTQFSLVKADGRLVVRVGVEVAVGATVRVRLLYTEPGIPPENSSLVFFEQKQPGAGEDSFTLILTYPETYTPKSVAPRADVGRNSLTFTSAHDVNRLFAVGF